jgi:AraC-like DNA-binding protein
MPPSVADPRAELAPAVTFPPPTPEGYVEHSPPPALRAYVECFWSRGAEPGPEATAPRVHRVLPDGCIDVMLVRHAGTVGSSGARAGEAGEAGEAQVVGTMTRAIVVETQPGDSIVAVRFRPGWARAFLDTPASALTDVQAPLTDVWRDGVRSLDDIAARIEGDGASTEGRLRALEQELLRRLPLAAPPPADVDAAVAAIVRAGGNLRVGALAADIGLSRQHLARLFDEYLGITPKAFARVARMRALLARVQRERDGRPPARTRRPGWSTLALDAGYYDQSHLTAEFRALTGLTPEGWLAER